MSGVTQERDILNQEKLLEIVQKIEKTEDVKILESHVRSGTSAGKSDLFFEWPQLERLL